MSIVKQSNILLVNPKLNSESEGTSLLTINEPTADYPINLIYLGGYLENQGHNVHIIDAERLSKTDSFEQIRSNLANADLVGITVMTPALPHALELSDFIKSIDPTVPIVWGGIHPTLFPHQTVEDNAVDFVIVGEGEAPLDLLITYLKREDWKRIQQIPNVLFKGKGTISSPLPVERQLVTTRKTRRSAYLDKPIKHDLATEPLPAYHLLELEKYLHVRQSDGIVHRTLELITSRGCPYRCAFCIDSIIDRGKWSAQPVEKSLLDIRTLVDRYSIEHIFFMDENFFVSLGRAMEIIRGLMGLNITWEANIRAEVLSRRIPDDFFPMLQQTGCTMLRIGAESGSQRVLDLLQKDIAPMDILNAVKRTSQFGILCNLSFMIAVPGETKDDMMKTIDLINEIREVEPRTEIIGPQPHRPYPGSILYDILDAQGLLEKFNSPRSWVNSPTMANMRYLNVVSAGEFDIDTVEYLRDLGYIVESDPNRLQEEIQLRGDKIGRRFQGRFFKN